jgi:Holliday junction resolvase RusA-like endonuclease
MKAVKINIKPLSVNGAFQGRRFKSKAYIQYSKDVLLMLPKITIPPSPLEVYIKYGFSNKMSDVDNPTKCVIDLCQKKYNFNDRDIYRMVLEKEIVPKGQEFFEFEFKTYVK